MDVISAAFMSERLMTSRIQELTWVADTVTGEFEQRAVLEGV
jgi:hypothetical protein